MSRELRYGVLLGKGSVEQLIEALEDSLGSWAKLLPYLSECNVGAELELVASINYLLGKEFKLTPPLAARIAECLMRNPRLLASLEQLLVKEQGDYGEEGGGVE